MAFYVYPLASRRHETLHLGMTNDLVRRIHEHKAKVLSGFTARYGSIAWFGSKSTRIRLRQ